jgi:hypothetical protein
MRCSPANCRWAVFCVPSEKSNVARGVDEVVMRALEKERERRQQSATEMKTEVEHATTPGGSAGAGSAGVAAGIGDDEWMLRCPSCGKTRRLSEMGGVRIGAVSIGKRVLSKCSSCGFRGMALVIQAREARTQPFVPDAVAAREQGRGLALWGAWLQLVPFVLAIFLHPALD